MRHWDESYEQGRERQRDEERRYENDVFYDVWRSGGNPDRIDHDRVSDSRFDGLSSEDAARRELKSQRPPEQKSEEQEWLENGGEMQ